MAIGPGKYDELATYVRKKAAAQAVVVIVVGGHWGAGYCVQSHTDIVLELPPLLRRIADDIEAGAEGG